MKILNLRAGIISIVTLVFMAIEPCVEAQTTKPAAAPATPPTTQPAPSAQQLAANQASTAANAAEAALLNQQGVARQQDTQKYLSETKIDTSLPALGTHTGKSGTTSTSGTTGASGTTTSTSGTGTSTTTQPPSAAAIDQQYIALVAKLGADNQAAAQAKNGQSSDTNTANFVQTYQFNTNTERAVIASNGGLTPGQLNSSAQILGTSAASDTAKATKVQAALTALQAEAKQDNITLPTQSAAAAATDEQVAYGQLQLASISRGMQKIVQADAAAGTPLTPVQVASGDQTLRTAIRNMNLPAAATQDLIAQHLSDLDNTYNTTLAQLQAIPAAPGVTALEKRETDDAQAQAVVAKDYSPADVQVWQAVGVSTGQIIPLTAPPTTVPQN